MLINFVPTLANAVKVKASAVKAGDLLARGDVFEIVLEVLAGGLGAAAFRLASGGGHNINGHPADANVFIFDPS